MSTSGPNYVGTAGTVSGTWATLTNAQGSTEGTFATFTSTTANATATMYGSAFGTFTGVGAGDTIDSVQVEVRQSVNNTSRMLAPQYQLWNGTTAQIGATQTGTLTTTVTNDSFTITGVTFAQLSTLRVRVVGRKANSTQSGVQNVDWIRLTVNYTVAVGATVTATSVDAVAAVPTPTALADGTATPSVVAAVAAVPSPALSSGSTASPPTVAGTAAVPAPTVGTGGAMSRVRTPWTPPSTDNGGSVQAGVAVQPDVDISVSGVWWYQRTSGPTTVRASLWNSSGQTNLADSGNVSTTGFTTEAWNLVSFGSPVTLTSGGTYVAAVLVASVAPVGYDPDDLTTAVTSADGHVTFPSGGGRFNSNTTFVYPASTWSGMHAVDVEYSLAGGATVTASVVVAVANVPAPTISASATVMATSVDAVAAVPTPTVTAGGSASVNADTVVAVASVPTPTLSTDSTVTATAVVGTTTVPTPTVTSSVDITLTTVAGVAAIATPTVTGQAGATVTPATVMALASVPAPEASASNVLGAGARIVSSTPRGRTIATTPRRIVHTTPRGRL